MNPRLAWMGPRRIGALAGLAPASAALVLFVVLGARPSPDVILSLTGITVLAVGAGAIVGPHAVGLFQSDLRAMVAYALLGTFVYLLVGTLASVWTEFATGGAPDLGALIARMAGQILYGLLFLPFWAGAVAPFGLAWVIAVRVLRRRAGLAPAGASAENASDAATNTRRISPRRMGLFAAAVIVAYGLFVAVLPLVLYNDPRPPWWIDRPIALFSLFAVPAVVAAIGALRGVGPLLAAAGVICLLQAYIAFSGVMIGFVVPAVVLLWAASAGSTMEMPPRRVAFMAGIIVIVMTVAAWVALLSLTEPRCWTGQQAADGTINRVEVPATDATLHGPIEVSSGGGGCSSAELTIQGMGVSAVLAIGAIAVAAAATSGGRKTDAA
jgi:hypothetical protein